MTDLLQAVEIALLSHLEMLNDFDRDHPHHGDRMVEVFKLAKHAADGSKAGSLGEALDTAGARLLSRQTDDLARIYGQGLCKIAEQIKQANISFDELVLFTRKQLGVGDQDRELDSLRTGQILKALTSGLLQWKNSGHGEKAGRVGIGDLLEIGIAYQQAKSSHADPAAALAQAAVSISPLKYVQVFALSGRIAFESLLRAIAGQNEETPS